MADRVFGYGSLANAATHAMRPLVPAILPGWRRVWVRAAGRPVAFLSVEPAPGVQVAGALAPVDDWAALDAREWAYARRAVTAEAGGPAAAQVYAVPPAAVEAPGAPILLSYLDTVAEGFAALFGPAGVAAFFDTTAGWDAPVLDDRAAPRYPRATRPGAALRAAVDARLAALGARVTAAG